jgi:hypothetical protein
MNAIESRVGGEGFNILLKKACCENRMLVDGKKGIITHYNIMWLLVIK